MTLFLAACAPHSVTDWLLAIPISSSSCRLRFSDEAVALCLGCSVCVAHSCFRCGSLADAEGLHGLVCKQASSKTARHHAVNDLTAWCFHFCWDTSLQGASWAVKQTRWQVPRRTPRRTHADLLAGQ